MYKNYMGMQWECKGKQEHTKKLSKHTRNVKECKGAAPKYKEVQRSDRTCNEAQETTGHARSCKELENLARECTIPDPSPNTPRTFPDPTPTPSERARARAYT